MFRLLTVVVLLPVLAGCAGLPAVCPAIMYGSVLTVRLADDWPAGGEREVTVGCPQGENCGQISALPIGQRASEVLRAGAAEFSLVGAGEELVVTVREAGADVTSMTVEPEWVRVGGSEACGGPMDAEVVVPAP